MDAIKSPSDFLAQASGGRCPLLELPGELRNRIYDEVLRGSKIRVVRKVNQQEHDTYPSKPNLWNSAFGLTQVCRTIRTELLPLHNARKTVYLHPEDVYSYIDTFHTNPHISNEHLAGCIILDIAGTAIPCAGCCVDIKPLILLLQQAKDFYIGFHGILDDHTHVTPEPRLPAPSIQAIITELYDIVDMDAFHAYLERGMNVLEVEHDEMRGVEIVFELRSAYWEDWMGVWSKPDHGPDYRIPLELGDRVVEWGRGAGMELDRAAGSHLTVNFRRGV